MSEYRTESFQPTEPEQSYDWDYDDEPQRKPRVLWGRIALLAAFLLVAFLIGRASAPGGISQTRFQQVVDERDELREENEALQAAAAQEEAEATTDETAAPTNEQTSEGTSTEESSVEGETYVVESGDTLRGLSRQFYGTPFLDECIQVANDIIDPSELPVGIELVIPPEESC